MFKRITRKVVSIFPKKIQDLYYKYEEVLMYLIFGVLTTVVSFVSAGLAKYGLECFNLSKDLVSDLSTVISWICAVTFAYVTNKLWVFDSKAKGAKLIIKEAVSFYGGRVFTLIVEVVIMRIGFSVMGINFWVTKIAANVVVLILNYIISKIFVFKNKEKKNEKN